MKFITLALLVLLAFAFGAKPDNAGNQRGATVITRVRTSSTQAVFDTRFKNPGEGNGKMSVRFQVSGSTLRMEVKSFFHSSDNNGFYHAKIRFDEIIEYRETNGERGFQPDDDVVSSIEFDKNSISIDPITCNEDDGNFICTISTTDGQFSVVAHLVDAINVTNGLPQKPTEVKFDVLIDKNSRTSGTRIALLMSAFSLSHNTPILKDESDDESSGFSSQPEHELVLGAGAFSWVTVARINGVNVTVINSGVNNGSEDNSDPERDDDEGNASQITFSFDSTEIGPIVWDPKLIGLISSSYSALPAFFLITAIFVLFL